MLVVVALAVAAAVFTAHLLNRLRITRFIAAPPLFLIAMVAIYAVLFSTFIIRA
jgi:hypothetical protein